MCVRSFPPELTASTFSLSLSDTYARTLASPSTVEFFASCVFHRWLLWLRLPDYLPFLIYSTLTILLNIRKYQRVGLFPTKISKWPLLSIFLFLPLSLWYLACFDSFLFDFCVEMHMRAKYSLLWFSLMSHRYDIRSVRAVVTATAVAAAVFTVVRSQCACMHIFFIIQNYMIIQTAASDE